MKIPNQAPLMFGAKKRGDDCIIKINNNEYNAKFLGRGRFTSAFLARNGAVFLWTFYGDFSKEILSHCANNKHIPKIQRVQSYRQEFDKTEHIIRVYRTQFYGPLTAKTHPAEFESAKRIARAKFDAAIKFGNLRKSDFTPQGCYLENKYVIRATEGHIPYSMTEALTEINDNAAHYDSYLFDDFYPRNCGISKSGHLVFLDALFGAKIVRDDIIIRDLENKMKEYK